MAPAGADLQQLLDMQRLGDSGAYVSSGFDDWRTPSKYRSRAGLHYGFDIAMWAGSKVRAAWSGEVIAISRWYGREYGVTVRSSSGYETTYGHISPRVSVGDRVLPGDVLGTVVVDHVDVKMRNSKGNYVDFAALPISESPLPSRQAPHAMVHDLSAAKSAYERYLLIHSDYEKEHFRYSQGWGAKAKLDELGAELKKLKPLALVFKSDGLPALPSGEAEKQNSSPGRPLTDQLLLGAPVHSGAAQGSESNERTMARQKAESPVTEKARP